MGHLCQASPELIRADIQTAQGVIFDKVEQLLCDGQACNCDTLGHDLELQSLAITQPRSHFGLVSHQKHNRQGELVTIPYQFSFWRQNTSQCCKFLSAVIPTRLLAL